jgi:rhodanese-related sulfurtransferase
VNSSSLPSITVQELHELAQRQPVEIIDVRTPKEFREVRATGVRLVPLDEIDARNLVESRTLGGDEPIYFICHLGGRSARACMALIDAGYPNVVNVAGGTEAWEQAGLPVERG